MIRPQPLNVFQRLARTWDAVHPYNAGQACRVAGTFDADVLDDSWNATLRAFGFDADEPAHVHALVESLPVHFTSQLNRRFYDANEPPFRAFRKEAEGGTWLGVVYHHWVADSVAVRLLMRDWLSRLIGLPTIDVPPLRAAVSPDVSIFPVLRRYSDYRRTRKVLTMGPLDYPTRTQLIEPTGPIVPQLLAHARKHDATLNDLFLAALAEACSRFVPTERRAGRDGLAISSVVDLRRTRTICDAGFGCALGFNSVAYRPSELADWERLLRATARRRETRSSGGTLWMLAAEVASRFSSPGRLYDFYRKEAPFAGGISNVNLNGTWFGRRHPQLVLDYVRVSPTGPMVPVAVNVTTLGERLHLSMTYRSALLNDWTAKELAETFLERLTRIPCGSV